ncbi:hypothetical protein AAF712_012743 [Marasmius tenuissimus]|uniref:Uncharacterized protein n=1 Tax=Marasmius tenuissimus TaxID=585030 RepID=A0ABR2ZGJ3_9AGAR
MAEQLHNNRMMVTFGVANERMIVAGQGNAQRWGLPDDMKRNLAGNISPPYRFVSLGLNNTWFVLGQKPGPTNSHPYFRFNSGHLTHLHSELAASAKQGQDHFPQGVSFGSHNAYAWWSSSKCHWRDLGKIRSPWLTRMRQEKPNKTPKKLYLGAEDAVVLIWSDKSFDYYGLIHSLAEVLHGAKEKGLTIDYLSISPANRQWWFIQFSDHSVSWSAPHNAHSEEINDFATSHAHVKVRSRTAALDVVAQLK